MKWPAFDENVPKIYDFESEKESLFHCYENEASRRRTEENQIHMGS